MAGASLSRMVLAPVAGQLGTKRLMIVADGALHFVPFAALPVVSGGAPRTNRLSKPLIADHEIVNLPSASTLAVVRGEVAGRQKASKAVVALADPVFMKSDERVKQRSDVDTLMGRPRFVTKQRRSESTMNRQLVKEAADDTGIASDELYVPRLPGTRREAERIVAMVPDIDRRLALDFAANRETAMSAELGQYRYVHFSTHGLLNSVHPELSGVVFSLVNERGEDEDGFLRAHELFNLKLPAEVVVLSACQTGVGKTIRGEGLVSLTRGFMYAGAPRVVVSLWGVSDWGTTDLMVRFYQGMLNEGMRPAAALRTAQLSLMNDKRWTSPYYWAPFTLQGEWR
jgi:CHAT domain-containing protein